MAARGGGYCSDRYQRSRVESNIEVSDTCQRDAAERDRPTASRASSKNYEGATQRTSSLRACSKMESRLKELLSPGEAGGGLGIMAARLRGGVEQGVITSRIGGVPWKGPLSQPPPTLPRFLPHLHSISTSTCFSLYTVDVHAPCSFLLSQSSPVLLQVRPSLLG